MLASVSLGSNIDREANLRRAIDLLREIYGRLTISPVYETEAVGFDGDDFLNLVICFETGDTVESVWSQLKNIEDAMGRDRSMPRFSARSIDLDLLTYGDLVIDRDGIQLPRHEILTNAFVLKPMSDIMGAKMHPQLKKTYHELWESMSPSAGRIEVVRLELD